MAPAARWASPCRAQQIGKPYEFTAAEQALCREKLWTASLFKRSWDHHRAKLGR
jgi:hypothetical protein